MTHEEQDRVMYGGWLPPKLVEVILAAFIAVISWQAINLVKEVQSIGNEVAAIKETYVKKDDYRKAIDRIYTFLDKIDGKLDRVIERSNRGPNGNN